MRKNSGVSLFLIELIIMLCVFMIAAGIDAALLSKAGALSRESRELNYAAELCASAAEYYKATGREPAGMTKLNGVWSICYDESFTPTPGADEYTLTLSPSEDGADVNFYGGDGENIFSLSVKAAAYD